jgi:hypothetical protein
MVSSGCQVIRKLLYAGFVRDRRPRVLPGHRALRRVLAVIAVDLVQPLGPAVIGLELDVVKRPGGRDPVGKLDLAEVGGPQPVQRRAVHFGRAADEVMHLRLEPLAVFVVPRIGRDVPAVRKDRRRIPVLELPGEEVAALQQQDLLSGRSEGVS